jgi:DNA-binding NtrC family response regulator
MKKRRILVIDDERAIRQTLAQVLADEGYEVETSADGIDGLDRLRRERFDLAFLDVWLKDKDGLAILAELGDEPRKLPIVMISGHANVETAVRAVKMGAYDFLEKPLSLERVLVTAQKAIDHRDLEEELARFREKASGEQVLIGQTPAIARLREEILRVAPTDARVLITGESGTGKEMVARLIHDLDQRPGKGKLVVLDCTTVVPSLSGSEFFGHDRGAYTGAVSAREGAFELADGGTLFLDEVGELPAPMQAELLRVVQEGTFKRVGSNLWRKSEFRLICATNRNLEEEQKKGTFRSDFYYRIASWKLHLPGLRQRVDDIVPLFRHFYHQHRPDGGRPRLDDAVRDLLLWREYPGNVRDLRNLAFRVAQRHVGDGPVTIGDIPEEEWPAPGEEQHGWRDQEFERCIRKSIRSGATLREITAGTSETAISIALADEGGNLRRAARRLGVTDRALQLRRAARRDQPAEEPAEEPTPRAG